MTYGQLQTSSASSQQASRAFLIGIYHHHDPKGACQEHLDELSLLAKTFGLETAGVFPCLLKEYDPAKVLTKGKLEEASAMVAASDCNVVIFDDEISPAQQRNLEKHFGRPVIDRTELILGVFGQRAQTKEAKLQIALAQVNYQLPRLKRLWTHLERQAGGGSSGQYLKGAGETQMEIDRRLLRQRRDRLAKEIEEVRLQRKLQRSSREKTGIPTFALIGYTNVGKSTLMNALTHAGVFVEDKLFATLDTTTRKFLLPDNHEILLIDTVGFIRKLPHPLVAAFRSTLEEAFAADVLIHLIDVSHPMALEQAASTYEILKELGASKKPIITVLNKIDQCQNRRIISEMRFKYPKVVEISALRGEGFEELLARMVEELQARRLDMHLKIPQSDYHLVTEILQKGKVFYQEYEGNDIVLRAEVPLSMQRLLRGYALDEEGNFLPQEDDKPIWDV